MGSDSLSFFIEKYESTMLNIIDIKFMEKLVIIGQKIRSQRLKLNLRIEDVARKTNISRATLGAIENGKSNCSIKTLFVIFDFLGLDLNLSPKQDLADTSRRRAQRLNTKYQKDINRFIVMCVEQYANYMGYSSSKTYQLIKSSGVIDDLINDYEDLHGMSTEYLNDYISSFIDGDR